MGSRRRNASRSKTMPPVHRRAVEELEPRQLLSVATPASHHYTSVDGFTPAQIRHAYGFDQVQFDGSGQTIAIVDAFDSPTIIADLHTFDTQFNLPDPVLNKFNQNGRRARGTTPSAASPRSAISPNGAR